MTLMRSKTVPPPTQGLSESSFRNNLLAAKCRKFPAVTTGGIVRFGTEKRVSNDDDDDDVNYAGSVAIGANCLKLQFLFFSFTGNPACASVARSGCSPFVGRRSITVPPVPGSPQHPSRCPFCSGHCGDSWRHSEVALI